MSAPLDGGRLVRGDVRLAVRTEGPHIYFYLAKTSTMEGANILARFDRRVLEGDVPLGRSLIELFSIWLQRQVSDVTGIVPIMQREIPPEPPEGNA